MTADEVIKKLAQFEELQNLTLQQASDYQLFLSANLWQTGSEIIRAEQEYNKCWKILRDTLKTDKETDKVSTVSAEWVRYKQAVYAQKTIVEVIRSLKKKMQIDYEEMRSY